MNRAFDSKMPRFFIFFLRYSLTLTSSANGIGKYVHFLSSHNIHVLSVDVSCFSFPVLLPHNEANFCSGQKKI